jgi:hypothetical protein
VLNKSILDISKGYHLGGCTVCRPGHRRQRIRHLRPRLLRLEFGGGFRHFGHPERAQSIQCCCHRFERWHPLCLVGCLTTPQQLGQNGVRYGFAVLTPPDFGSATTAKPGILRLLLHHSASLDPRIIDSRDDVCPNNSHPGSQKLHNKLLCFLPGIVLDLAQLDPTHIPMRGGLQVRGGRLSTYHLARARAQVEIRDPVLSLCTCQAVPVDDYLRH